MLVGENASVTIGLLKEVAEAWERGCEKGLRRSSSDTMKSGMGFNTHCIDLTRIYIPVQAHDVTTSYRDRV
jgi:hypothetical protein